METPSTHSCPTRCVQCQKPMDSPIACSGCGALTDLPADAFDCFELFGLAPAFDIDLEALHRTYLGLSRLIHPDLASREGESDRRRSLMLSARFNQAYEVLRHPVSRAEYLLRLVGGATCCEDRSVPEDLLSQVLALRERIEEASASGQQQELDVLAGQVRGGRDAAMAAVGDLARQLVRDGFEEGVCRELRRQLNAVKYWESLLEQISAGPVRTSTR